LIRFYWHFAHHTRCRHAVRNCLALCVTPLTSASTNQGPLLPTHCSLDTLPLLLPSKQKRSPPHKQRERWFIKSFISLPFYCVWRSMTERNPIQKKPSPTPNSVDLYIQPYAQARTLRLLCRTTTQATRSRPIGRERNATTTNSNCYKQQRRMK